jgi:hypothetical protein
MVVTINQAWRALTAENGSLRVFALDGGSFISACERATALDGAPALAAGMRQLLARAENELSLHLSCDAPTGRRWLEVRAAHLPAVAAGYIITYQALRSVAGPNAACGSCGWPSAAVAGRRRCWGVLARAGTL